MTATDRRELILYATPTGTLGRRLERFFTEHADPGTTAQTYPPHVTLTGFFRRSVTRRDEIVAATRAFVRSLGPPPDDAVAITELRSTDEWCGLVVESDWLVTTTERWIADQRVEPDEDRLRPKTWLHLSLAYGDGPVATVAEHAVRTIDPASEVAWEVGLWERLAPTEWIRLV